ncbi:NAD(P)-binding protein [Hypoxylon crocopeplum]|nr:NAD(P)-binding protein [Hypoxylon crocopeplum]
MSTITKVAVAGATGNVGPAVVNQLVQDGFKVTVLLRKGRSHSFPSSVAIVEVDYESPESLFKALEGQDAVVSAVGFTGLPQQIPLIRAAVKAGVKRFLPSEFGGDAENEKANHLPPFHAKKEISDALKKEAASGTLTYSLVSTGPFLDMGLQHGFIMSLKNKSINLFDGGDRPFSTSSIPAVAKAVSGVLKHPEETKNRNVFVHVALTTQNELLEKAKKVLGPEGWQSKDVSTDDALKQAYAKFEQGEIDRIGFISAAIWGEGYGSDFKKVDNQLLGIEELGDAEIQSLVESLSK